LKDSSIFNEAGSPLSFWILDAEALGLNSNGCGHVRKKLQANNILTAFCLLVTARYRYFS
jgi:hypothetical protein